MEFTAGNIYHIYNRGNDKQSIFFNDGNYIYFLQKVRKYMTPHCDILAYVLMPNHFHFMIYADNRTEERLINATISRSKLSEGIRLLLSSYTKGVNKQQSKTGNLLQQNTKSKCVFDMANVHERGYASTCFHYIHQNPYKAGFVNKIEDWHYSSYRDYAGIRNGTLCNQQLAKSILEIQIEDSLNINKINSKYLENIW